MRTFTTILKILMVFIFIISLTFNFLIFNSSYGTLIFKHNDDKFLSLVSTKRLNLDPNFFLCEKNIGLQINVKTKENDETTNKKVKIHLDKESKITVYVLENNNQITYYQNGKVYDKDGNDTLISINEKNAALVELEEINVLQDILINDIPNSKNKVKIDFSFSPFYFIGFKYTVKETDKKITYNFDLNGNIRKINIENENGVTINYSLEYKNEKITIPTPTN